MKTPRRSLLSVLPALALLFAACGGPTAGNVAVVKTDQGDINISKAQFQRFFNASLSQAQQKELSKTTALEPPAFTACVTAKRKEIPEESQRKKTSDATLKKQCQEQYDTVRNQAMQQIINLDWIKAELDRRGIKVRKAEQALALNTTIKQSFGDQKGFQAFLKQSGMNADDIDLYVLGQQIGQQKIIAQIQAGLKDPTDTEVKRYFEEKKAQYVQPETRDLRLIKVADEATAKKVYDQLKAGGSWKALAKQYSSDDATKDNGGVVLGATADTQPPEFGGTVFKAKAGSLLEPVKTSLGWYVVRVQKVTAEKQPNFKELEPQLKQALQQENQQTAIDDFKNLFYARWGARTTCASGYDDLVACGGDAASTTPVKLPAPPGAGVPQFPKPKADPNAALQQLQQQGAAQQAPQGAATAGQ
ncbi:MAG: peptidyl-prolyl cis-trans isomerase [Solirubrobacteraceae bacterium]|nr:peptidyl-prolyl cis-trans isomerase [Solirubrobacteraceae bacterium]